MVLLYYSEKTAQKIDSEIFSIVDGGYQRAKKILTEKRDLLDKLAEALLKYETIDGIYVYDLVKNGKFTMNIVVPEKDIKSDKDDTTPSPKRRRRTKKDDNTPEVAVAKVDEPVSNEG